MIIILFLQEQPKKVKSKVAHDEVDEKLDYGSISF